MAMSVDRVSDQFGSSSGSSTTLRNSDATMTAEKDDSNDREEQKRIEELPTPPVIVPTVPSIHGNDEILPAEADNRDQEIDEEKTPDSHAGGSADLKEPDIFDRFSPGKKRAILAIVSYSAFISRMFTYTLTSS